MRNALLAVAISFTALNPLAKAAANDSTNFNLVRSAGAAACLKATARGRVSISDLGPVQNMHVELFSLPANTEFTLFVINTPTHPSRRRGTKAT